MTIITGSPATPPEVLEGWKAVAVFTLRILVGDIEATRYTNSRLIQAFQLCANLVMFDVDFPDDYTINLVDETILPEPSNDFITLVCFKTACVLLTNEGREASGCKIMMKDGPSQITMDKTELVKTLKDSTKSACDKYMEASFIFKSEGTLGVAVLGPHGIGATYNEDTHRQYR